MAHFNPYSMTYDVYGRPFYIQQTRPMVDLLSFKLCVAKRDRYYTTPITMRSTDTIEELKEKVADRLTIRVPLSSFFLEVYDRYTYEWKRIDDGISFRTLSGLNLNPEDFLSIQSMEQPTSSYQRSSYLPSSSINTDNLTLYLCKTPFDTSNYTILEIPYASTIGKLRRKVCEQLNKSSNNQSLFLRSMGTWMKFDTDMDSGILEDYPFKSYSFITLDYNDDKYASKSPKGLCGLGNLGSTCYMNTVFQCFSNIPELTKKIIELPNEINAPIIDQYRKLLEKLWSGQHRSFDPSSLVRNIKDNLTRYDNYRQQDAQEFMNDLLNLMHAELSTSKTLITDAFYGQMQSKVTCLECQNTEITNEPISFLPLPIGNCNQKTILYVKTNGEYHTVSLQVDTSIRTIGDLIACFVSQHEPSLLANQIRVVKLIDNRIKTQYDSMRLLSEIQEEQLAFLQCPSKSSDQKHILCEFIDVSTAKDFRPPSILVIPSRSCSYYHLSDQLDDLLGHLCSVTNAPPSGYQLYWVDSSERRYRLDKNDHLSYLSAIQIAMPLNYIEIYNVYSHIKNSTDQSALKSLIADFFHEEPLDSDYHCDKCSKSTKARQKSSFCLPLPRVLIIQLKRFSFDVYSSEKIDTFISFPLDELDLSEYVVKDSNNQEENNASTRYSLVAISNHIGSLTSGHYTTYAKNKDDNQWYLFDDTSVKKVNNDQDIITKNAYILVYVRKD